MTTISYTVRENNNNLIKIIGGYKCALKKEQKWSKKAECNMELVFGASTVPNSPLKNQISATNNMKQKKESKKKVFKSFRIAKKVQKQVKTRLQLILMLLRKNMMVKL